MRINYLDFLNNPKLIDIQNWRKKLSPIVGGFLSNSPEGEPDWWIGSVSLGNNPIGLFYRKQVQFAAGASIFIEEAITRTTGEVIERYASLNSYFSDKDIALKAVDPSLDFVRCLDTEPCYPYFKQLNIEQPIEHTTVINLVTDEKEFVPVEHIHLGFIRKNPEEMVTSPVSTGCAFHSNKLTAIWSGICEVVERDALMRFWYTRAIPNKININSISDYALKIRVTRIKNKKLKLHLFEISQNISIPTILAVIQSDKFPYFCVGASTNTNILNAINKAIDEAISIRTMAKWNNYKRETLQTDDFSWVNSLVKHMDLYANWNSKIAFNFFIDNSPEMCIDSLKDSKDWLPTPDTESQLKENMKRIQEKGFTFFGKIFPFQKQ
jgi:ribosomal protein S12 methylthiotransferase accessory factor